MPGSLDHIAEFCAGRNNNTEVRGCLWSMMDLSNNNTRGWKEVVIRSFGAHVAVLASFGHLMSLQGGAGSWSALVALFCQFGYPGTLLVQVLIRITIMVTRILWRKESMSIRFTLAACLGVHASSPSASTGNVPLVFLRLDQVKCKPRKLGLLWIARLGLLLAFLAQYAGSAALWIRLVFHLQDRSFWFWHMDMSTFEMVVGGFFATINSSLILLIGGEWKMVDASDDRTTEVGMGDTPTSNEGPLIQVKSKESSQAASTTRGDVSTPRITKVRRFNTRFEQFLDRYLPGLSQLDLECGVILHRVFVEAVYIFRFRRVRCPPILSVLSHASGTYRWDEICVDQLNVWDPTTFLSHPRTRLHLHHVDALRISDDLFNIGLGRILFHWLFWIVDVGCERIGKTLPRWLRSFEQWILSGRSLISFPTIVLLFACCPIRIISMVQLMGWVSQAQTALQGQGVSDIDRMAMNVLMWKDPWQDNLYII